MKPNNAGNEFMQEWENPFTHLVEERGWPDFIKTDVLARLSNCNPTDNAQIDRVIEYGRERYEIHVRDKGNGRFLRFSIGGDGTQHQLFPLPKYNFDFEAYGKLVGTQGTIEFSVTPEKLRGISLKKRCLSARSRHRRLHGGRWSKLSRKKERWADADLRRKKAKALRFLTIFDEG